jgi:uncharacterized membrane protein YeaQ/YmgE (transglycosylase-associated protein family)
VNLIAWIVLGVIAGHLAGLLVKGDERLGFIGHTLLGLGGALIGGLGWALVFHVDPMPKTGFIDAAAIVAAVAGAVVLVVIANVFRSGARSEA